MNATPKTKLCWNCETRVNPYEENCPCCCVYLNPSPKPKGEREPVAHVAPPYQISEQEREEAPPSPYSDANQIDSEYEKEELSLNRSGGDSLLPMILLLCGSIFLLFSISLYLFSVDGVLTLKWNGHYWYIYLVVAVPLLFFGWRSMQTLADET